jgi:site-specific DNA-methyltransferase (adenine-specific)/adenine-specific DNA-methyltransferase
MTPDQRQEIIRLLQEDQELSPEWARILFPPEKREYELVYYGKEREEDIIADTLSVPLQPIRTFGLSHNDWTNMLIFGDNLQVMKSLLEMKNSGKLCNADGTPGIRLIYIDPPFGTGDIYSITDSIKAYSAKLQGRNFIEFLRRRLLFLRDLLSADGSIYIRLDYHFGHYIKIIADEVFGAHNFKNEIIINRFKRQLRGLNGYNVATDSLFFYSKNSKCFFQEQFRNRLCSFCGRPTAPKWIPMSSPGLRNPPERKICGKVLFPPKGRHWTFSQVRVDKMQAHGFIRRENNATWTDIKGEKHRGVPEYLQTPETPADTNWTDIRGYVRSARYPTENPEELLERVINASSSTGDIVLDAFAGSGTTLAVAEKLSRRWIGIDCGKLAIYTMQKRLLNLRKNIGNKGPRLKPKYFSLYNAGLYDFSMLKDLPWEEWRKFALMLFSCREEKHSVGGIEIDGYLKGAGVIVFNHLAHPGARFSRETLEEIHQALGSRIGSKMFIIAPALTFDFQQDYIDLDGVRYYALRIPYSIINELHRREFTALRQPTDERSVNDTVEAVGFDFIRTPEIELKFDCAKSKGELFDLGLIKIKAFKSDAVVREPVKKKDNFETLSMVMVDINYDETSQVFDLDTVFYANDIRKHDWVIPIPFAGMGEKVMAVFIDIYGNEAKVLIDPSVFKASKRKRDKAKKAPAAKSRKK